MKTTDPNARGYGWKGDLAAILREHNWKSSRRPGKRASTLTMKRRTEILFLAGRELRELGYKLQSLRHLRPKHIEALARHWEAKGQSPSTLQTKLSTLRSFCAWIGKSGMMKPNGDYVSDPQSVRRTHATREDKSWSGRGVDFREIVERIRPYDATVALQLELQRAFGLRRQEAWCLRPAESIDPNGKLIVKRGTKGGRARIVDIETDAQRELLERAKAHAGMGSMVPPQYTLATWKHRYCRVLRKFGVTKKGLGVVSHGMRHDYAHDQYRARLGDEPPVRGGPEPALSREERDYQRKYISELLGHSRTSIISCYAGSLRVMAKEARREAERHPDVGDAEP